MTKHLLFTLTLLSFILFDSSAQISINQSHMPAAGDTNRYSISILDTNILANYQKNGANQVWNFSALEADRQNVSKFINSSNTPYNISNKIAEKIGDTISQDEFEFSDIYEFYTSTPTSFTKDQRALTVQTGIMPIVIDPVYSDPDEVYQLPLNYLDIDSSTFKFTFNFPLFGVYYSSEGERINAVDGWGIVHTPYGSFNCLRVVTDIISYDSISFNNDGSGTSQHLREYKWLVEEFSIPAIIISGSVNSNDVFIPLTVEYRDSVRGVPSIFAPIAAYSVDTQEVNVGDPVEFTNNSISLNTPHYQWTIQPSNFNFTNGTHENSENPVVIFTDSGHYDVQLIVSNSYGKDTLLNENYIQVLPVSGIGKKLNTNTTIQLSPNPVKNGDILNVKGTKSFNTLKVFNIVGSLVYEKELSKYNDESKIILPSLKAGNYFIQLSGEQSTQTLKLIIID